MGLAALTRRGWQKNPKAQGKWNFYASIFGIIVGNAINYFLEREFISGWADLLILGWGIFSYLLGIFLESCNRKHSPNQ